jgi:hypothetical protein
VCGGRTTVKGGPPREPRYQPSAVGVAGQTEMSYRPRAPSLPGVGNFPGVAYTPEAKLALPAPLERTWTVTGIEPCWRRQFNRV